MNEICVAVLGDIFIDVTAGGLPRAPSFGDDVGVESVALNTGGSALNTALQLKSLCGDRMRVRFFGALGCDTWADIIRKRCALAGVDLYAAVVEKSSTGVCIVLSGCGDRGFVSSYAANKQWRVSDIDRTALFECNHIHIGGYFSISAEVRAALPALLREAREVYGCTVSFDTNFDGTGAWDGVAALLPLVDVFLPNEVELLAIAATLGAAPVDAAADQAPLGSARSTLDEAVDVLLCHAPFVVATCGASGVVARQCAAAGGACWRVAAEPPAAIVDATGCGDAFNAGFISAWLGVGATSSGGAPRTGGALDFSRGAIEAALVEGCAVGTIVIARVGACIETVTPPEVVALLALRSARLAGAS
jgi:sugar/nucleoside kinase (ribokinase family)